MLGVGDGVLVGAGVLVGTGVFVCVGVGVAATVGVTMFGVWVAEKASHEASLVPAK